MTDEEVNNVIEEFMYSGKPGGAAYIANRYTKSLDALVPVWNKLKDEYILDLRQHFGYNNGFNYYVRLSRKKIDNYDVVNHWLGGHVSFNIREAAAHATAKAILELK